MTIALNIARCSLAAQLLLQRHDPVVGYIHSCYGRIINIQTPESRLLTLQGPGPLQAPGAVSVRGSLEDMIPLFSPGDVMVQGEQELARFQLLTPDVQVWDGRLAPVPGLTASRCRVLSQSLSGWLQQHAADKGIVPILTALETTDSRPLSTFLAGLYRPLANLMVSSTFTPDAFMDMATLVVGLGDGLTPSGDDLVVGVIAVFHVANQVSSILGPLAAHSLVDHCACSTTDLSTEFVRCAIEGHFSEPLIGLMRSLYSTGESAWDDDADRLAQVGHSSGVDAMVGIVLGGYLVADHLLH